MSTLNLIIVLIAAAIGIVAYIVGTRELDRQSKKPRVDYWGGRSND